LFTLEQHRRFIGEEVALRLRALVGGRRRVTGRLRAVGEESLQLEVEGEPLEIPYREVERSRLVPDWTAEMNRQRHAAAD
jgi:ribosome maturation factor RimP